MAKNIFKTEIRPAELKWSTKSDVDNENDESQD